MKRRSPSVSPEMAAIIKTLLRRGLFHHEIAALFGINQGRVSEIRTGKRHPDVPPAPDEVVDQFLSKQAA